MSLKAIYHDDEVSMTEEEVGVASSERAEEEVEMNWNLCSYLPDAGSCQDLFRVLVAGHIHALYTHEVEGRRNHAPGSTPIQRHTNSTQSQVVHNTWYVHTMYIIYTCIIYTCVYIHMYNI